VAYDLNEGTIKWRTTLGTIQYSPPRDQEHWKRPSEEWTGRDRGWIDLVGSNGDRYIHAFIRTLGKSFGKRRSKGIRTEFRQCTR